MIISAQYFIYYQELKEFLEKCY